MAREIKSNSIPEMCVTESKIIPGVFTIRRGPSLDDRGFFREVYRKSILESVGVNFDPVQMNHSRSETGVIRGIHGEKWDKLVYPLTGIMVAVIVDLRIDKKSFGRHEMIEFDCVNKPPNIALFLPVGVGNSICATKGPVDYIYAVDAYWTPNSTFSVRWNDPDLNISWPIENPIITEKDKVAPLLRDLFPDAEI